MDWNTVKNIFIGSPSKQNAIMSEWRSNLNKLHLKYDPLINSLEQSKMNEIGYPSENAPKTIDAKLHRLETLDSEIEKMYNKLFEAEDVLWLDMMEKVKQDQIDSSNIFGKIWLWMYWHI